LVVRVGILGGTGPAGSALALRLADAGAEVVVGSRSEEKAAALCVELSGRWPERQLSLEPAKNLVAARSDLVIVATPWDAAASMAASVGDELDGRVVISMANALAKVGDEFQALVPPRGSVAAGVAAAVPSALVAAAFHHLPARSLGDLSQPVSGDVLICSDHDVATKAAGQLVDMVPGLRALAAGRLTNAGPIESFTAVLLELNRRYRSRASIRIEGIEV